MWLGPASWLYGKTKMKKEMRVCGQQQLVVGKETHVKV
jgi:hypothetical protein